MEFPAVLYPIVDQERILDAIDVKPHNECHYERNIIQTPD